MAQPAPKFIQIAAGFDGLYALDEYGDVWHYQWTDQYKKQGKWTRLEKPA